MYKKTTRLYTHAEVRQVHLHSSQLLHNTCVQQGYIHIQNTYNYTLQSTASMCTSVKFNKVLGVGVRIVKHHKNLRVLDIIHHRVEEDGLVLLWMFRGRGKHSAVAHCVLACQDSSQVHELMTIRVGRSVRVSGRV